MIDIVVSDLVRSSTVKITEFVEFQLLAAHFTLAKRSFFGLIQDFLTEAFLCNWFKPSGYLEQTALVHCTYKCL